MGAISSCESPLLDEFQSPYWACDVKAVKKLIQRFEKCQTEFGWALTYDTYRKLYAKHQPVIPEAQLKTMYKIWDKDGKNKTDVLQIFAGSIICSEATFADKVLALFDLFDMDMNKHISRDEMTILIKASLNGYCRMIGLEPPVTSQMAEYARLAFKSADRQLSKDNRISSHELLSWAQCTPECVNILCRFHTIDGDDIRRQMRSAMEQEQAYNQEKAPIPTQSSIKQQITAQKHAMKKESSHANDDINKTWKNKYNIDEIRRVKAIWDTVAKDTDHIDATLLNHAIRDSKDTKLSRYTFHNPDGQLTCTLIHVIKQMHSNIECKRVEIEQVLEWMTYKPVPENIITKIKSIFDECDRDCTGEVSLSKLLSILAPSAKLAEYVTITPYNPKKDPVHVNLTQLLQRIFGKTHKQQMEQILTWGRPSKPLTTEQRLDLTRLFELYDNDSSGAIDFNELKASAAEHFEEAELKALFSQFDFDNNKMITLQEFLKFYRNVWDSKVNFSHDLFSTKITGRRKSISMMEIKKG